MESTTRQLDAALAYAKSGYPVFPCVPGEKRPATRHGCLDATTDLDQIERWWKANPEYNIGLHAVGLIIIDFDMGNDWLADEPDKLADLNVAPTSRTPSGGKHVVFRKPAGKMWKNTANQLATKIDTRTDGGYIVVAPSVVNGVAYEWLKGQELGDSIPEPPAWLVLMLDERVAYEYKATRQRQAPVARAPRKRRAKVETVATEENPTNLDFAMASIEKFDLPEWRKLPVDKAMVAAKSMLRNGYNLRGKEFDAMLAKVKATLTI